LKSRVLEEFWPVGASPLLCSSRSNSFAGGLLLRLFGNQLLIQVRNLFVLFFKFTTLLSTLILVAPRLKFFRSVSVVLRLGLLVNAP
jgi:hypothetical protein